MTKFGVHSLVFGDIWDETHAKAACRTAREIGFDLIEVLVFEPATLDVRMTAKEAGIGLRLGIALGRMPTFCRQMPASRRGAGRGDGGALSGDCGGT